MNPIDHSSLLGLGAALLGAWTLAAALRRLYVTAQPDEWLLCLRDGHLVRAGVGVSVLRRPGDVVVRFSSTMQRVAFAVDAITREHLAARVEGFIFWSVSPDDDAPLRAYSRLGIANLLRPPPALRHPKHLLTSPQHKAFQQILSAVVQRHASTMTLDALIAHQDALVGGLTERLRDTTREMGVRIDQVEVLTARPADAAVLAQLSAAETERLRETSQALRREADAKAAEAKATVVGQLAALEGKEIVDGWLRARLKDEPWLAAGRKELIEDGFPEATVKLYRPEQVLLHHLLKRADIERDEVLKWLQLPYWQVEEQIRTLPPLAAEDVEGKIVRGLIFAGDKVRIAQARVDARLGMLRLVEAIRLYGAANAGQFPATLEALKLPLPTDPFSGKSFKYTLKDGTATLQGATPRGMEKSPAYNVRYELTWRKEPKK